MRGCFRVCEGVSDAYGAPEVLLTGGAANEWMVMREADALWGPASSGSPAAGPATSDADESRGPLEGVYDAYRVRFEDCCVVFRVSILSP